MDSDIGINIDLHNLEDVKFEGSKYVLTSPRSLEACSRLNVKPVELLYKPLSEFQEEMLPQDIPLRTIYTLYDESEQIRQKKLKLCREERSRLLTSEDKKSSRLAAQKYLSTLPSQDYTETEKKHKGKTKTSSTSKPSTLKTSFSEKRSSRPPCRESTKLHRELLSKKDQSTSRPKSTLRARPQSSDGLRKAQRCSSSVTRGTKVKHRSGSTPNVSGRLPARDEKILKLMKQRREEERQTRQLSENAHRMWDDEKKREEALRIVAENKRRQLLAEENRILDRKMEQEKLRQQKYAEEERELRKLAVEESQLNAERTLMNQLRMKELQLSDKIRKEKAKTNVQKVNMKSKEQEDDEVSQLLVSKQLSDLQSASERKDVKLHQDSLKKFMGNRQEREHFEQRQNIMKSVERENKELARNSMKARMGLAENNLSQLLEQRHCQLQEHRRESQAKQQRARQVHRQMDSEMEAWRHGILEQKHKMEERASDLVNKNLEMRAFQAKKNRIDKEVEQRKNIKKIHKDVERWRRDLGKSLEEKDRKIDELLGEKERTICQTRATAQFSQMLRDDIREKYVSDTFDRKVLEAQLHASIDRGTRARSPSLKNRSSINIC